MRYILYLFFLGFALFIDNTSLAQTTYEVEILHADSAIMEAGGIETLKKLLGHVLLKHQTTQIQCDSAVVYASNNIDAYGHVKIWKNNATSVTGNTLKYISLQKMAMMDGKCILTNGKAKLYTDNFQYNLNEEIGTYSTGGKLVNEETTITSRMGKYYSKESKAIFNSDVVLTNPKYNLTGDSLTYNTKTKRTYFSYGTVIKNDSGYVKCNSGWHDEELNQSSFGYKTIIYNTPQWLITDSIFMDNKSGESYIYKNFLYKDSLQKIQVFGDSAILNNKKKSFIAFHRPLLVMEDDSIDRNTYIKADVLKSYEKEENRALEGIGNARIFNKDFQGMSGYLKYSTGDSSLVMKINPYIWYDANQVYGDTILIFLKNKKPYLIHAFKNGFLTQKETIQDYNQISGDTINIYLKEGKLDYLVSNNNAKSIYYAKEEGKGYLGMNHAECKNLRLQFDSGRVDRIIFYQNPKATFYPVKDITSSNKFLSNFVWKDADRPKSKDDLR